MSANFKTYTFQPFSGNVPKSMVILLHGVGSNGQDLISLAPYLAKELPDTIFLSPDAPFEYDMAPPEFGPQMRQWFSLQDRDPKVMLSGVQEVTPLVHDYMSSQLQEHGVKPENLVLLGFSQGTMTSLYAGLRYSEKIAGILGYSGALLWEDIRENEIFHKTAIRLEHGKNDMVVPVDAYHMAVEKLSAEGFDVSGETHSHLEHSINEKGLQNGLDFLKKLLG